MILVVNDFFGHAAVVCKGEIMSSDNILRYKRAVLPMNEFISGMREYESDEPALDCIPLKILHFCLPKVHLHLLTQVESLYLCKNGVLLK